MKAKKVRKHAAAYAAGLNRPQPGRLARNSRGEPVKTASVTATVAKNEFGRLLETVIQGGVVAITKHGAPKAVLISIDEFNASSKRREKAAAAVVDDGSAGAWAALLARLRSEPVVDVGRWTRDELYEDGG